MEVVIDARYNGPPGTANGGYICGLLAGLLGAPAAEVTLRRPPPLDRPLRWEDGRLLDGELLVAEARAVPPLELDVPEPVSPAEAEAASAAYDGFREHAFPTCFVCGPARDDGLRVFAGPVAGRDVVASPWTPADGRPELVWAALDCPGAFAVGMEGRGEVVLARLAADVERLPEPGAPHVVVAWPLGEEGRKLHAGSALFTAEGELLARARALWIAPR